MKNVVIVTNKVTKIEHVYATLAVAAVECGVDKNRLYYVCGRKDAVFDDEEWFIRRVAVIRSNKMSGDT